MTDLDEIERLLAKATPGEWEVDSLRGLIFHRPNPLIKYVIADMESAVDENAALITALRNAAPAMIAELKALRRAAAMGELTASTAGEYGEVEACVSGWEVDNGTD